jgi:hypothetical protein
MPNGDTRTIVPGAGSDVRRATSAEYTFDCLHEFVGRELCISEWIAIDQARIVMRVLWGVNGTTCGKTRWCIKIVRFVVDWPDSVAGRTWECSGGNSLANRLLRLPCQLAQ